MIQAAIKYSKHERDLSCISSLIWKLLSHKVLIDVLIRSFAGGNSFYGSLLCLILIVVGLFCLIANIKQKVGNQRNNTIAITLTIWKER